MAKADFHLVTFVQENFLNNHIYYVKLIGDLVTKIKRVGDGLGIHMVDNDMARMVTYTANKDVVRILRNGDVMKTFITGENATATTTFNFQNLAPDCVWPRWWAGEGPTRVPKDIVRYMSHYNNK